MKYPILEQAMRDGQKRPQVPVWVEVDSIEDAIQQICEVEELDVMSTDEGDYSYVGGGEPFWFIRLYERQSGGIPEAPWQDGPCPRRLEPTAEGD